MELPSQSTFLTQVAVLPILQLEPQSLSSQLILVDLTALIQLNASKELPSSLKAPPSDLTILAAPTEESSALEAISSLVALLHPATTLSSTELQQKFKLFFKT